MVVSKHRDPGPGWVTTTEALRYVDSVGGGGPLSGRCTDGITLEHHQIIIEGRSGPANLAEAARYGLQI
jgi:hypothetical protein